MQELEQYTQRIDAQRSPPAASDDEGSDDYATPLHNTATVALNDVHVLEIIGSGGFGNVYKALWNRQLVAVKVMEHGAETLGLQEHQLGDGDGAPHHSTASSPDRPVTRPQQPQQQRMIIVDERSCVPLQRLSYQPSCQPRLTLPSSVTAGPA